MLAKGALVNGLPQSDLTDFGGNPLIRATRYGHEHAMRTLMEFGAEVNIRILGYPYSTLLTVAHPEAIEYLLEEIQI